MASEASVLTIVELTGQQRTVQLVGRGLPYRPLGFSVEQRVTPTWNPGSPEATATVLGPKEMPTTMGGEWKDKFIDVLGASVEAEAEQSGQPQNASLSNGQPPITLNNEAVSTVDAAIDLFDSLCREGQLVEVTWFTTKRQGYLRKFSHQWNNTHDVIWTANFEWIGRGEPRGLATFVTEAQPNQILDDMNGQFDQVDDLSTDIGYSQDFVNKINAITSEIQRLMTELEDTVVNYTNQVLAPSKAFRAMIANLQGIEMQCEDLLEFMESAVAIEVVSLKPGESVEDRSEAERLEAEAFARETKNWARALRRVGTDRRAVLVEEISGDIAGTYTAREGDDLRRAAVAVYGTPYEWQRIQTFNDLDSARLQRGQVVLVPKLNPEDARA